MKEIKFDNATVRITLPTEKQKDNIRRATEIFLQRAVETGLIKHGGRKNDCKIKSRSI